MGYRIGSFNCCNLGRDSNKDIGIIANIICEENFDIVALQEIKGEKALQRILNRLPKYWCGKSDNDFIVNDYAFLWNSKRIELARNQSNEIYKPRIYKQYKIDREHFQRKLIREPFFARFIPVGFGAPFIEIRLLNTHIRFSKSSDESNTEYSPGAIELRRKEFDILTKAIYAKEADKRYGNNRPAYTIMLGDYNLNIPCSGAGSPYLQEYFEITDNNRIKRIKTEQKGLTTLKKTANKEKEEHGFSGNYDHFTFDLERFDGVDLDCSEINAVNQYCNGDFEKYEREVSDHIPILMKMDIRRK